MKIGIVTQSYYPRFGGVTEHVHHTAKELIGRGHDVTVITSHFRREHQSDLPVERIGRNLLIPFNRAFVDFTIGWNLEGQLRALFRKHRFDVIHTHCPAAPSLPLLAVAAADCPQVGTFHMTGRNRLQEMFREPLARRMERLNARIAVSPTALECAEHYFGGDYLQIPNGVDVARFHPDNEPFSEWRSKDHVNVLFVGRLDPRKGVDLLIGAVPEIVQRTAGRARFIVVGDSYLKSRYEASVAPDTRRYVTFTGAASAADLPRWFATADVFVSPATGNESFGIVLLEAMASGCPIVCADIPGYRAAVDSNAAFHAPRDVAALADTVSSLVLDERRREQLAGAGRKRALEFTWPNVTERIEKVYRTLLGVSPVAAARSAA